MREDGKPFNDKRTFCGLNRFDNSYGYTSAPLFDNQNANDYYCHFCYNGYKEKDMPDTRVNAQDRLVDMETVHSDSIVKAIEKRVPQPHMRSRIFATIAAEERRRDAVQHNAEALFYTKGQTFIGRKIEIPCRGTGGVLTDVIMPDSKTVVVVFGGKAESLDRTTPVFVFPLEVQADTLKEAAAAVDRYTAAVETGCIRAENACPAFFCGFDCLKPKLHVGYCVFEREDGVICLVEDDVLVPVNEELRRQEVTEIRVSNPDSPPFGYVHTTIDTLIANRKQYKGYTINVCGIEGAFTDGKPDPTQKGWHVVVIDGRVHEIGGKTAVTIQCPKPPGPRVFAKYTVKNLYEMRYIHTNKTLRNDGEIVDLGKFTDIAPGRNQFVYTVVIDGKIINYAADAVVWVEL